MNSGGCAGPTGVSVTYSIMKKNYSVIGMEMIPRQRNILVTTFDQDGNIIETKLDSAQGAERIKSAEIKKLLKDQVDRIDFRLENQLSKTSLKLIPCLPDMKRYWLELDGFVRGDKKHITVEPPAKICFMISKSLVEVSVGEPPEITFFNELRDDLEYCMDTPNQGKTIRTISEHVCIITSSMYYTKPFVKDCQDTVRKIAHLTEKVLKNFPQLHIGKYSRDLSKIYYRYPPGLYEDNEANTCDPKDNSYNISFRFGFWQVWFEIIITIKILPENALLNIFTVSLRDELFNLFNP